ncbi:hypothetical protein [Phaeocystidibacter marisrubri]|uniref:Uncharacterized protein n=1 Tax=Phaeocystidibacter marisrubri TaxID=1577780 RepID=A0A6L3ZGF4_9FLAO|nr:hypothetical protein [Phaeocystidibacter marisrubri]KAB2816991.1 hypothetical protein F8C82_00945 [Phaeocystidibacter marisrubri]GGH77303.1 hypothetical protein GCM10011318_26870 [Phaeocystidibacter marisrubri]
MGSEQDKATFIAESVNFKYDIEKAQKRIVIARRILAVLSILYFVSIAYITSKLPATDAFGVAIIMGIIPVTFLISAIFMKKAPLAMAWLSLGVYITYALIEMMIDPITLLQGLVWRVLIIGSLSGVLVVVHNIRRIAKKSNYFMSQIFPDKKFQVLDELNG